MSVLSTIVTAGVLVPIVSGLTNEAIAGIRQLFGKGTEENTMKR